VFLPGTTTRGHYQIEFKCEACHQGAFTDVAELQAACESCHAAELKAVHDSHPKSKFTDPRNASRVALLDARLCVTCHREHTPHGTRPMGLTLPTDYCYKCHSDIAEERPSHEGMAFDTCASAGCHNFHDNQALYEDYLAKHLNEDSILASALVPKQKHSFQEPALLAADADGPVGDKLEGGQLDSAELEAWVASAHAKSNVNCRACHGKDAFKTAVNHEACSKCHEQEASGWLQGLHGMRVAQGLPAMCPSEARLPMHDAAAHRSLDCQSCHAGHRYDTERAAYEACVSCHDDQHTRAYTKSKHFALWQAESAGSAPPGSGVSCATCHMPRRASGDSFTVEHNQNANLRPNEKMIRGVCTHCHGVAFAIDALADPRLLENNFLGQPEKHVASVSLVRARHLPSGN
jgi:hypothetical protein